MVEVLISGVGTIGPQGSGWSSFVEAMDANSLPLSELDRSAGFHRADFPSTARMVPEDAPGDWIKPVQARRLSKLSKYAVCAAGMALHDAGLAGLEREDPFWDSTAVCLGNPWGSTIFSMRLMHQIENAEKMAISPVLFMDTVANAAAAQVALAHPAKGPNLTLTQREASDFAAVIRAATLIANGRAQRVLAGVSCEISTIMHAVLGRFGALTKATIGRPFDLNRDGFVPAEGATMFVLESAESAAQRDAPVRARLAGWGRANDPTAPSNDWGEGAESLSTALQASLARFGIAARDIDRVISGASGSKRGDALEAHVLRSFFGDDLPPLVAPKALVGECGGGYLASVPWAASSNVFPPALSTKNVDPRLGVTSAGGCELPPSKRSLATAFAAGGSAFWMVLENA